MPERKTSDKNWFLIPVICLLFGVSTALIIYKIPPLFTLLIDDFCVDPNLASWLMTVIMFAGIVLAIPTGLLERRFGVRSLVVAAVCACAGGCALSALTPIFAGSGIYFMIGTRVIEGVAYIFCTTCMPVVMSRAVPKHRVGIATSTWGLWCNLGGIVANSILPAMYHGLGFSAAMLIIASANAVIAALMFLLLHTLNCNNPFEKNSAESNNHGIDVTEKVRRLPLVLWTVSWIVINVLNGAIRSYLPACIQYQWGTSAEVAGQASTIMLVVSIFACLIFGFWCDKTRSYKIPYCFGILLLIPAAYITFANPSGLLLVGAVLAGIGFGSQAVSAMAVFDIFPPKLHAIGIGYGMTVCCLGQAFGNSLAQMLVGPEFTNWQTAGVVLAVMAAIGFGFAIFTKSKKI